MKSKAIQSANLHAATTHAQAKADAVEGKPKPAAIPPWPWVVHEERFVAAADGSPVVNMFHPNKEVAKVIAPLLAAAPELLEALEAMIELPEIHEAVKSGRGATMSALHRARSAIAKTRN